MPASVVAIVFAELPSFTKTMAQVTSTGVVAMIDEAVSSHRIPTIVHGKVVVLSVVTCWEAVIVFRMVIRSLSIGLLALCTVVRALFLLPDIT